MNNETKNFLRDFIVLLHEKYYESLKENGCSLAALLKMVNL
jgi:hypothetical protein